MSNYTLLDDIRRLLKGNLESNQIQALSIFTQALEALLNGSESTVDIVSVSTDTALTSYNSLVLVDASGGPVQIDLPPASDLVNITAGTSKVLYIKKSDATGNAVTITASGSDTIEGSGSVLLSTGLAATVLISDGNDWLQVASNASGGGGGGSGDVVGPATSTDNAIVRFSGTTGNLVQDSGVTVDDSDNLDVPGNITVTGTVDGRDVASDGTKLDGIEAGATADQSAAEVPFTPDGDIAASDVQAAIVEVRDDADTKLLGKLDTSHEGAGGAVHSVATTGSNGFMSTGDKSKLDGIEAGADVTDAANVDAAGALMDSEFAGTYTGDLVRTGAATYAVLRHNLAASIAPTVSDDDTADYAIGSRWLDTTADRAYLCLSAATGAAVWVEVTNEAAPVDSVFGRTGTVVATAGDYSADEVTNTSGVTGAFVDDALNTLDSGKADLAGQLGGTAASPDVRGIRETSGPTLLTFGAIADSEYLVRSGSTIVGGTPSGGGGPTVLTGDTSASPATVNLPAVSGLSTGDRRIVLDIGQNAGTNAVTINPSGSDTINGVNDPIYLVVDGESVTLIYDGAGWRVESWSTGCPPYAGITGLDGSNTYQGTSGDLPGATSMYAEVLYIPTRVQSDPSLWGNMQPATPVGWRIFQATTNVGFEFYATGGGGPNQATSAVDGISPRRRGRMPMHIFATLSETAGDSQARLYVDGLLLAEVAFAATVLDPASATAPAFGVTTFSTTLDDGVILGASYDASGTIPTPAQVSERFREIRRAGRVIAGSLDPEHRYDGFDVLAIPATWSDVGSAVTAVDLTSTGTPTTYRDAIWR